MRTGRRAILTVGLALIVLAVTASPASAAATRAEYVAQTDAICASAERETKDLFRKSKKAFGKLGNAGSGKSKKAKKAARKLMRKLAKILERSNGIFERMLRDISAIAPAPGDEAQVTGWLTGLNDYAELNDDAARALRKLRFGKSIAFSFLALDALTKAADWVDGYGFQHCPGGSVVKDFG